MGFTTKMVKKKGELLVYCNITWLKYCQMCFNICVPGIMFKKNELAQPLLFSGKQVQYIYVVNNLYYKMFQK